MNVYGAGAKAFCLRTTLLLVLIVGITASSALAQAPGVSDNSILVGSCSALDGPARFLGNQTVLGARTYLHSINDDGGVFGRKGATAGF